MTSKRHLPLPGLDERETEVYRDLRRLYPESSTALLTRQAIGIAYREKLLEKKRRRETRWARFWAALDWFNPRGKW